MLALVSSTVKGAVVWNCEVGGVLQTCKPGSVSFLFEKDGDHLSSPTIGYYAGGSPPLAERRYRRGQAANPGTGRAPKSPYLALLQVGFSRRRVTASGRTLLPSDFTLASTSRGGMFLCHFPFPINRDLGVTQHPAQRSPDFPPFFPHEKNGGHPVCMALRSKL